MDMTGNLSAVPIPGKNSITVLDGGNGKAQQEDRGQEESLSMWDK